MRGRYIVVMFTAAVLAALAGGFLFGANYTKKHQAKADTNSSTSNLTNTANSDALASPSTDTAGATTADPATTSGATTYTIQKGDTLYSIGLKFNVTWPVLAKANNLQETSVLKAGQIIQIPSADQAKTIQAHTLNIVADTEETQTLQDAQNYANAGTGQLAYRLVPCQVAVKAPIISRFGFSATDLCVEKSKDLTTGIAIVEITHTGSLYTITLNQPLSKGDKGVWSPTKIVY